MRALDGLGNSAVHSDAEIDTSIILAKSTVDRYTGNVFGDVTTPAYDAFTTTLDGNGHRVIRLVDGNGATLFHARTVSSVTIDGVADAGITYKIKADGDLHRSSGAWSRASDGFGQNIVVVGTYGYSDTPPELITWACESIARFWLINLKSRMPDRALNLTTADGSYEVRAQSGGVGRPTAMPDVNTALNLYRDRWDL